MRKKDQNPYQGGYPQQNGYLQGNYPGGTAYPGYPAQQGYQNPQDYQNPQGYPQTAGYTQMQGYQAQRTYQTPQVPAGQPAAGVPENNNYAGQASYAQNGYGQNGYTQPQNAGYPGGNAYPQQNGYPQTNNPAGMTGYTYPAANQQPAGSYIPQTPYSPGYTTPGYQAPNGYAQGYNAYTQMGRQQVPVNPMQEQGGQVPLNGGGYVPQPVPVRKQPFVLTDAYLLIICAVLLTLFALGMFVPGMGIMKWVFIFLTAGAAALLWLKNLTENNKRLCFSIVFGVLALVTIISFATGGQNTRKTNPQQQQQQTQQEQAVNAGATGINPYEETVNNGAVMPDPAVPEETPVPEGSDEGVKTSLTEFMKLWAGNDITGMEKYCDPQWLSKQENVSQELFKVTRNRIPVEFEFVGISGTPYDTMRTITTNVVMNKNDGKPNRTYSMEISMKKGDDDQWYVDPSSIQTNEAEEPTITPTIAPTPTPETYDSTPLYYNPDGGSLYHRDPNCKKVGDKYKPLQGSFTYGELLNGAHSDLKPCHICGAPNKPGN